MLYPDISHWVPVKNWDLVKNNCGFLISKATQGIGYVDSTLISFINGCEKNGIPYWLYVFLNKGNEEAQAKFMVNYCKYKVGKYFQGYILDIEQNNSAAGVQAALDYLKKLDCKCMIYTMYAQYSIYKSVIDNRGYNCGWWEARYGKNTGKYSSAYPCHKGADLHQFTSRGTVPGIAANGVDLSRLTGTKNIAWFTGEKTKKKKSNEAIAKEVIAGKWGNGDERKKRLREAGYDYSAVQKIVNKLMGAK